MRRVSPFPQHLCSSSESTPARVSVWTAGLLPGSETFIRNQTDALRSWQVGLCGLKRVESSLARESDTVLFGSSPREKVLRRMATVTGFSRRVRGALEAPKPDLVHVHFVSGCAYLVTRVAARCRIPVVVTAHGFDVTTPAHKAGPRGVWARARIRATLRRASLVVAVSEFIRLSVLELGGDPAKVIVHHIGIPVPPPTPPDVKKRWDVAFVGRFVEKKGILDLVEALGQLGPELRPSCVFIGDGPLSGPVRKTVQQTGIDATFLGAQPPEIVQATLQAARIFAAPSRTADNGDSEGFGMVFLEAAAAGLPVVSTLHGGIPEAVMNGITGLLSPEGDVDSIAENLRSLLLSPDLCASLGAAGRLRVKREFDIGRQTALLEEIYDAVARGDRPVL